MMVLVDPYKPYNSHDSKTGNGSSFFLLLSIDRQDIAPSPVSVSDLPMALAPSILPLLPIGHRTCL